MTIEWEPAMWSDALDGTRVKVQGRGVEVVGVLISMKPGAHVLQTDWNGTVEIERPGTWEVFTEVPAVVLPTEIGYQLDREGELWYRQSTGANNGHHWQDSNSERFTDEVARKFAPFTHLRPVAEVAAEVLTEWRRNYLTDDPTYWARLDALAARWAKK